METTYRLEQTGQEVQDRLNKVPTNEEAIAALQQAITQFLNTTQVQTLINTALTPYSTTAQMNTAITNAITQALANYYTKAVIDTALAGKQDTEPGKGLSTEDFTTQLKAKLTALPNSSELTAQIANAITTALEAYSTTAQMNTAISGAVNTEATAREAAVSQEAALRQQADTSERQAREAADTQLQQLITSVQQSLVNYYLKSETYSKTEVNQLIANIKQFSYQVVPALPETPGPDTMGIIYLVPAADPKTSDVKDEFITILEGSTYKWEKIGQTTIDLSNYPTIEAMNTAIANALANYYTKAQVDALVQTINQTISGVQQSVSDEASARQQGDADNAAAIANVRNTTYTKTETDNLLSDKQTAQQVAAAIASALTSYYTKTEIDSMVQSLNSAIGEKQTSITDGAQVGLGYGTSSDNASVQARTATLANFIMLKNMPVSIRFTTAINVDNATLNINSQGAKPIMIEGAALQPGVVKTGNVVTLIYDGTNWNIVEILNVLSAASGLSVDMGLPSGRLWAIANLDVTTQSGFAEVDGKPSPFIYECTFFSWGNTEGHNPISTSAFSYDWGSNNEGPYAQTPGAALTANAGLSYDAARAILGSPWRDPSTEDYAELFANIDFVQADGETVIDASQANKLVTVNNVVGIYLKSKINSNLLFFACCGYGGGQGWGSRGSGGDYWSRSLNSQANGRDLGFYSGGVNPQYDVSRFYGFARRAVQ